MKLGEVAEWLRVAPVTIYRLVKKGQLAAFKVGIEWRIRRVDVEAWMVANAQPCVREALNGRLEQRQSSGGQSTAR